MPSFAEFNIGAVFVEVPFQQWGLPDHGASGST
jgi:hypothetical protein